MPTNLIYLEHICPFKCVYCFSKAWHYRKFFDRRLEKVKEKLKELVDNNTIPKGSTIILHGGESGLIPISIWEEMINFAKSLGLRVSVQTNVWSISEELLELIIKEELRIGVSLDGPPELSVLRGVKHDLDWWDTAYENIMEKIEKLSKKGLSPGLIVILHKYNIGTEKRRKLLIEWAKTIGEVYNITGGLFNPMISFYPAQRKFMPTNNQLFEFYKLQFEEWTKLNAEGKVYSWYPTTPVVSALLGLSATPCWMQDCNPYETVVLAINSDGTGLYICDRTHHIGFFIRTPKGGYIRNIILRETDCKDCKYWEICHGGCPMEAYSSGFWMSKTQYCEAFKEFFEYVEKKIRGLIPCAKLSIDIPNWYEEFYKKGKRYNILEECGHHVINRVQKTYTKTSPTPQTQGHCDGIEHIDGNIRHLDSSIICRNESDMERDDKDKGTIHEDWDNHTDSQ